MASTRGGAAICLRLAEKAGAGAEPLLPPPRPPTLQLRALHSSRARAPPAPPGTSLRRRGSPPDALAAEAAGSGSSRRRRSRLRRAGARAMEHVTEGAWETLPVPLHPGVLGALRALGFPYMTPVQVPGAAAGDAGADGDAGLGLRARAQGCAPAQRGPRPRPVRGPHAPARPRPWVLGFQGPGHGPPVPSRCQTPGRRPRLSELRLPALRGDESSVAASGRGGAGGCGVT